MDLTGSPPVNWQWMYINKFPRNTVGFPHLYVYPGVIVDETFVLRCDNVARG